MVIAAMIWGSAFAAQSIGLDYMKPMTFNTVRCFIGSIVLLPVVMMFGRKKSGVTEPELDELPKGSDPTIGAAVASDAVADMDDFEASRPQHNPVRSAARKRELRDLWLGGILCGVALFLATNLQQIGLLYTSTGKAGFITTLYIVIVPVLGLLFGKRAPFTVWVSAFLALGGLYMLSVREDFTIASGDLLILLCALCYSAHIMLISYFSPRCNSVAMSCIQFFVVGVLGLVPMFVLERPSISAVLSGWLPLLYTGVLSCGVAYTLQIVAQKDVPESIAAVLMSLESVFSVLTGWLILNERLRTQEYLGCALIFVAVLLAQLPPTRIRMPWQKKKNLPDNN